MVCFKTSTTVEDNEPASRLRFHFSNFDQQLKKSLKQKSNFWYIKFQYYQIFFLANIDLKNSHTTLKSEVTQTELYSFGPLQPSSWPCKCPSICLGKQLLVALETKVSNWRGVVQILDIVTHKENPGYMSRT